MRYPLLIPALLLTFVGCQQPAPPEFTTYRAPTPGGYTGEIRPILAPLSLQYGPHENVALNIEFTGNVSIDGKTETFTATVKGSSSAQLICDT